MTAVPATAITSLSWTSAVGGRSSAGTPVGRRRALGVGAVGGQDADLGQAVPVGLGPQ
ncbi:hypothetical protein ACIOWG_13565 [Streptomyces sp. NPDC087658]|uniref:hypothetical protein n=1 Tax=Streptomyces sp. NPDC087658 TaxID=3365800 RepID=UPI0038270D42